MEDVATPAAHLHATCRRSIGGLVARGGWVLMVLIHLWPMAKVLGLALDGDAGGWLSLATLVASTAFFTLKAMDVPWLRLPRSAAARVAFIVIIALLHREAMGLNVAELTVVSATSAAVWTGRAEIARRLRRLRVAGTFVHVLKLVERITERPVLTPAMVAPPSGRARGPPLDR